MLAMTTAERLKLLVEEARTTTDFFDKLQRR
jgi:hypothetical protein